MIYDAVMTADVCSQVKLRAYMVAFMAGSRLSTPERFDQAVAAGIAKMELQEAVMAGVQAVETA